MIHSIGVPPEKGNPYVQSAENMAGAKESYAWVLTMGLSSFLHAQFGIVVEQDNFTPSIWVLSCSIDKTKLGTDSFRISFA